ncbi:hypothetical protein B0H19DRAFT_1196247, partial [Mycena capillaripes]
MSTVLAFVLYRRHFLRFVFPPQRHLADLLLLFLLSLPTAYRRIGDTPSHFAPGVPSPPSYIDMWSRTHTFCVNAIFLPYGLFAIFVQNL